MNKEKNHTLLAKGALLLCSMIWGGGFVVMKNALDSIPIGWLLALRFTIAALVLGVALHKRAARVVAGAVNGASVLENRQMLLAGGLCGLLMYAGHFVQTIGLMHTTVGSNAFLTAIYVVLVPFFGWAFTKRRPKAYHIVAGFLCLAGVGAIAIQENLTINIGDAWTTLCGIIYALHIVCVSVSMEKGLDALTLTVFQFITSSICALLEAILFEPFPAIETLVSGDALFALFYLGIVGTLFALLLQNISLRHVASSHASLLMSTEALFGLLFGILLLGEHFTMRFLVGAPMIIGSILLSELGANIIKRQASQEAISIR